VLDGLAAAQGNDGTADDVADTLKRLAPRWFVIRNTHAKSPPVLLHPRHAISFMRGPMTRLEIRAARGVKDPPRSETPLIAKAVASVREELL
jgi:hypothetical protein